MSGNIYESGVSEDAYGYAGCRHRGGSFEDSYNGYDHLAVGTRNYFDIIPGYQVPRYPGFGFRVARNAED
jgi:hypothetical protein